jgi:hypothetical protein
LKKHFVAGGTVSLAAVDAALEAAPGELKITFTPADASVAIVKGDFLKIVSSGVPLQVAAGTYTLTTRTADRFTRSSMLEVIAGDSKILNLVLAPNGMSKWDDPGSWKHEGEPFIRKGGDFVLYAVAPASGTFVFSAMVIQGHPLQWVLNYVCDHLEMYQPRHLWNDGTWCIVGTCKATIGCMSSSLGEIGSGLPRC